MMNYPYDQGFQGGCFSMADVYDAFQFFMQQNPPSSLVEKVMKYNYGPLEIEVLALALRDGLDIERHCRQDSNYLELSDQRLRLRQLSGQAAE